MPEITEVLRRSRQGITQPFVCRADDNNIYFVKGKGANYRSLLAEWFAGHIAQALNLPIPDFKILNVPEEFFKSNPIDLYDLGVGPTFGSSMIEFSQEYNHSMIDEIDPELRQGIAVYDWWIKNLDRTMSEYGGNPNILRELSSSRIIIIDHNLAFDPDFASKKFMESHAFARDLLDVVDNFVRRNEWSIRLRSALTVWEQARENAPPEWWFVDEQQTVPTDFPCDEIRERLALSVDVALWRLES